MTSIGLLLGVSAAKLGTMDMSVTRLLSIHVPALLPPTSTELDVPHNVQVAAVVGIGLVYQGTAHRHTAEVLLAEIGMQLIVLNLYRCTFSTQTYTHRKLRKTKSSFYEYRMIR